MNEPVVERRSTRTSTPRCRRFGVGRRVGGMLCACLLAATRVPAQDAAPHLTVNPVTGAPGAEATSLIYIVTPQPLQTGAVTLRLAFPRELVTFVKAGSYLATSLGVEVRATPKAEPREDRRSVVEVEVFTPMEGGKRKAIPDGMLAYVVYRISPDAKLGMTIPLDVRAVVRTTEDPAREVPAKIAEAATIVVKEDVAFSCFFYMH